MVDAAPRLESLHKGLARRHQQNYSKIYLQLPLVNILIRCPTRAWNSHALVGSLIDKKNGGNEKGAGKRNENVE